MVIQRWKLLLDNFVGTIHEVTPWNILTVKPKTCTLNAIETLVTHFRASKIFNFDFMFCRKKLSYS